MAALHVGDEPAPEVERLRVRVVDAEHADALADPELDDVAQLLPQLAPLGACRNRSARCPRTSSADSRRIARCRRAGARTTADARATYGWSGEHWNARSSATSSPSRSASRRKLAKSSSVPSSACTLLCPPSAAPIAHGEPGSARSRASRCCGLCGDSCRSDGSAADRRRRSPSRRRTRGGAPRSRACRGAQAPRPSSVGRTRTTRGSARAAARRRPRAADRKRSRASGPGRPAMSSRSASVKALWRRSSSGASLVERRGIGEQRAALGAARPRGRGAHERGAFAQREGDVVALGAPHELVPPGRERVDPRGDGVAVAAERRPARSSPPMRRRRGESSARRSSSSCRGGVQQHAGDALVTLDDHVGLDVDRLRRGRA